METSSFSTATEQTILQGDTTAKPPKQKFILRPAHLSDLPVMAQHAKDAYWHSPITDWIAPRAADHPEDLVRHMLQDIQKSFANASNLSLVVCVPAENGEKEKIVGYGQFLRKGNDAAAAEFPKSKGLINLWGLWILSWWFWAWHFMSKNIWPDRISDVNATKTFGEWTQQDREKYWLSHPERDDRWHAAVLVVSPAYQGKGIGRLLMSHVMEKAQQERVLMGLTASRHGEFLYRKLGFEMLGDFCNRLPHDRVGGGVMIWYPEGWEGKRHDDA